MAPHHVDRRRAGPARRAVACSAGPAVQLPGQPAPDARQPAPDARAPPLLQHAFVLFPKPTPAQRTPALGTAHEESVGTENGPCIPWLTPRGVLALFR